jgi:hypothetical protein
MKQIDNSHTEEGIGYEPENRSTVTEQHQVFQRKVAPHVTTGNERAGL